MDLATERDEMNETLRSVFVLLFVELVLRLKEPVIDVAAGAVHAGVAVGQNLFDVEFRRRPRFLCQSDEVGLLSNTLVDPRDDISCFVT